MINVHYKIDLRGAKNEKKNSILKKYYSKYKFYVNLPF